MSFGIFLNFEKICIDIIEKEISQMTNDNQIVNNEIDIVENENFIDNLYHGSIATTFIVNLYETALNTILGRRLKRTDKEIFKVSHDIKLQLICAMYQIDISEIKSDNSYGCFRSIVKLRNDITHYKSNKIKDGMHISAEDKLPFGTSKDSLAVQFTKDYIEKHYKGVLKLLELICKKCGLVLYKDCYIIDCDGRDCACEFILTQEMYDNRDIDY